MTGDKSNGEPELDIERERRERMALNAARMESLGVSSCYDSAKYWLVDYLLSVAELPTISWLTSTTCASSFQLASAVSRLASLQPKEAKAVPAVTKSTSKHSAAPSRRQG